MTIARREATAPAGGREMPRNVETPEAAAEWVTLDQIKPWGRNPRKNEAAVQEIVASIRRFGFGAPLVARRADGMLIAGHTRLKAAQVLGLDRVPVRWMDLDVDEAQLLAIADNKLGELAEWDDSALAEILRDLDVGEATEGLGFSEEELRKITGQDEDNDALVKEWTAAELSPREEVVVVLRVAHAFKGDVVEALKGFDVHRTFLSYDGAVKW